MNTLTYIQLQRKEKERAELQRIADWIEDNPGITAAEAMRDSGQTYYRLRSIDHLLTRKKNNEGPNEKVLLYRNDKRFQFAMDYSDVKVLDELLTELGCAVITTQTVENGVCVNNQ